MILIALLSIAGLLGLVLLLGVIWASRYVKVGPNKAVIVSGKGGQSVITGGARFVMPVLYKMNELDLEAHTVQVSRTGIYTKLRVPINVEAILVYKVNNSDEAVKLAAQSLLGKNSEQIRDMVESIAEGAFRDICGKMTPEEINEDRESFQNKVTDVAKGHFEKLGIELVTFSVRHISDDKEYFVNLGAPRLAEVDRDARQKRAEADRTATVTEAEQKLGSEKRTAETQAEILEAQKERNVKEQKYAAETATEKAKAEQAGPRATAEAEQEVSIAQTELAIKRAEQKQEELVAVIVKPAEADKLKTVIDAEAQRDAAIARAEGERKAKMLSAEATQYQLQQEGKGEAAKVRNIGRAEADVIKLKGVAEGEALRKRAEGLKIYNEAAIGLDLARLLIETLPEMITAGAIPLAAVDKIQMFDFGSNGSGPVEKFMGLAPKNTLQFLTWVKEATGVDLPGLLQGVQAKLESSNGDGHKAAELEEIPVSRHGPHPTSEGLDKPEN